ncbi:MAG: mechanosensitive ion channel [Cyclobacteriaceae bacterium]
MNTDAVLSQINQLIESMVSSVINLLPRILLATAVFFVGWLIAHLVRVIVKRLMLYLDRNFNEKLKDRLLKIDLRSSANIVARTFFWTILLFAFAVVTQILGLPVLTTWFSGLLLYLPNIIAGIIIVIVGIIAGRLCADLTTSAASRAGMTNGPALGQIIRYTIIFITVVIAVGQIGIDVRFLTNLVTIILTALLFGATLAFGLGARTSVSNILGSYYLRKVYEEGDTVKIDDEEGIIVKITATSVFLKTKEGEVIIPAKDFNEERTTLIKRN